MHKNCHIAEAATKRCSTETSPSTVFPSWLLIIIFKNYIRIFKIWKVACLLFVTLLLIPLFYTYLLRLLCRIIEHMTVCSYNIMYAFQSESTPYSCLNVKELLPWNMHEIWSLNDCNGTRTHNHLVHKWKLNHLAKLTFSVHLQTKWLWVRVPLQSLIEHVFWKKAIW